MAVAQQRCKSRAATTNHPTTFATKRSTKEKVDYLSISYVHTCSSLCCFEQCAQKGTIIESLRKIVEMREVLGFYILTDQSVKEILTLTSEEMLRLGAELYIISQEECFCM